MKNRNYIGKLIEYPELLQKYDLVLWGDTILSVVKDSVYSWDMGERLVCNFRHPTIVKADNGCALTSTILDGNYRIINMGLYAGWVDFFKECKLLQRNKGIRPNIDRVLNNYSKLTRKCNIKRII